MKRIIISFLGVLIATICNSQEKQDTSKHICIDEVIISANKWEQNIREIPYHLIVIKKTNIDFQNPQTAADLLSISGQVFVQKSQLGGGSPMIRGFATNRVLLVVDGVRLNNAIFRAGNLQNAILMDAGNIEASEIIFGPGSVTYGSDAIGGVMDFHTLIPKLSNNDSLLTSGQVFTRWSSANMERTGHLHFNMATKKIASLTSITYSKYSDLMMGKYGPDDYLREFYVANYSGKDSVVTNNNNRIQKFSGYSQYNILQKIKYKLSKNTELQYAIHYTKSSNIPRYDRLTEIKNNMPKNAEWYYGPQYWMMNSLKFKYTGQNTLFDYAKITIANQDYEESRHDRKFNSPSLRHRTETVKANTINIDFSKLIAEKNNLFYGFDIVFNTVGSKAETEDIYLKTVNNTSTRYPDGSTWKSYAAYATYKYYIYEKLTLQTGFRYNIVDINSVFDTSFYPFPFTNAKILNYSPTGNIGIAYNPNNGLIVNANAGTGFRAPNIDDMGKLFDSEPGAVVVPNPGLKPEYAYNYEFGITKIFHKNFNNLKIKTGLFYTTLKDALVRRDYVFNGQDSIMYDGEPSKVQSIINAAKAYVYGFYVSANLNLKNGMASTLNFNYQKGEEENNGQISPLRHAAPWFGNFHITYFTKNFKIDFFIDAAGRVKNENMPFEEKNKDYKYAKDSKGLPYCPGWYTINLKSNYKITKVFSVSAGIENIANKRYKPFSWGIAAPGRNFIVSLRADF